MIRPTRARRVARRHLPIVVGVVAFAFAGALAGLDTAALAGAVAFFAAKTAGSLAAATDAP